MSKQDMIFYLAVNDQKDDNLTFTAGIKEYIQSCGCRAKILRAERDEIGNFHFPMEECEKGIVIAIGGDGTLLQCVNDLHMAKCRNPIVGINLGTLGFLTQIEQEEAEKAIDAIIGEKFQIENYPLLNACVNRNGVIYEEQAFNDVVVGREGFARVIQMDVYIDDVFAYQAWCDGIVVATAQGSTAYNISLGGPIIPPHTPVFAITPIAPHMPGLRPIIVPDTATIKIRVAGRVRKGEQMDLLHREALMTCDGRSNEMPLESGDIVEISRWHSDVNILKLADPERSFYDILRKKLLTIV